MADELVIHCECIWIFMCWSINWQTNIFFIYSLFPCYSVKHRHHLVMDHILTYAQTAAYVHYGVTHSPLRTTWCFFRLTLFWTTRCDFNERGFFIIVCLFLHSGSLRNHSLIALIQGAAVQVTMNPKYMLTKLNQTSGLRCQTALKRCEDQPNFCHCLGL